MPYVLAYLDPDPSQEDLGDAMTCEVFRMVKKRRFHEEYKHSKLSERHLTNIALKKLDSADIDIEWNKVRKNSDQRNVYIEATKIYNEKVRNQKTPFEN